MLGLLQLPQQQDTPLLTPSLAEILTLVATIMATTMVSQGHSRPSMGLLMRGDLVVNLSTATLATIMGKRAHDGWRFVRFRRVRPHLRHIHLAHVI